MTGLGIKTGQHVGDLFGALSDENIQRVKRQNARKISVIIGNPPYNANQQNENDNNKNRTYEHIDKLIKDSYIRLSTAQKTKVYDMYARFFRWASDRMHDDGVLAFITNRSFIESRTFDGFRKAVAEEFNEIYVVDLGGDVRANPKLSGTKHNVFSIQTGVAISFFVKRRKQKGCKIFYARRPEFDTAVDKLSFLASSKLSSLSFERVEPDKKGNWINLTDNDWDSMIPVADKKTKAAKTAGQERAIFKLFSLGVKTNRDEWVTDQSVTHLINKVSKLISSYNHELLRVKSNANVINVSNIISYEVKWTRKLKRLLLENRHIFYKENCVVSSLYRPYTSKSTYFNTEINEDHYQLRQILPHEINFIILLSGYPSQKPFQVVSTDQLWHHDSLDKTNGFPVYRYTPSGKRIDNITDWGLRQFQRHYGPVISPLGGEMPGRAEEGMAEQSLKKKAAISKEDIFHYVYGVLHDPVYRDKYALNLKRDFPRIPFYPDFPQWAEWGDRLMLLHIDYEKVKPFPITRIDLPEDKARAAGVSPKVILKADADNGVIRIDSETTLSGIPKAAFAYRLGNRSGLEWILDQYKEKTPKDPTIREKFNTYRFADYKEKVIDLIARVTHVSVETMEIVEAMKLARRAQDAAIFQDGHACDVDIEQYH